MSPQAANIRIPARQHAERPASSDSCAILVVDDCGRIEALDAGAEAMLACNSAEAVGSHIERFLPELALDPGRPGAETPQLACRASGERFPSEMSLSWLCVRGSQLAVVCIHGASRARMPNAMQQREQKLDAIAQLAGGLAHDLNNLLTIILGNLQLVKRRFGDMPGLGSRVDGALGASSRAAELTRRLLGISHSQPMRLESVDVGALVTGLAAELCRTWGESIVVEAQIEAGITPIQTDRAQLEAALVNLCLNARDAMKSTGRLRLALRRVEMRRGSAPSEAGLEPGHYLQLEVQDDGAGMSPDALERAFDPFFTTKEMGNGAGLGLGLVHGYARRSRGAVGLVSEPGKGTSARLYLPAAVAPHAASSGTREANAPRQAQRASVLVVEDDADIREFASDVLRDAGYEVCEAEDGRAALEILQSARRFDLLLTDVLMPGVGGQQVACEARTHRPAIRVLYVSGYAPDALLEHGRLKDHENFLAKPYSADDLIRSVESATQREDAT